MTSTRDQRRGFLEKQYEPGAARRELDHVHQRLNQERFPPGKEIFEDYKVSVFDERIYCLRHSLTVTLPSLKKEDDGFIVFISDRSGKAATSGQRHTIKAPPGKTVNGASSVTIATNYGEQVIQWSFERDEFFTVSSAEAASAAAASASASATSASSSVTTLEANSQLAWHGQIYNIAWAVSNANYTDFNNAAGYILEQRHNNGFGTVTAYVDGLDRAQPGIVFTPPVAGRYLVIVTGHFQGAAAWNTVRLWDGTTEYGEAEVGSLAAGDHVPFTITAILNATAPLVSKNLFLQGRANGGTALNLDTATGGTVGVAFLIQKL